VAAAKLIRDMLDNHYDGKFLDGKLYNFKHKFFNLSLTTRHVRNVNIPEVRNKYWNKLRETVWARVRSGNFEVRSGNFEVRSGNFEVINL